MAVRFLCQQCRQLLSIGSRKAGTEIRCPTCGHPQIVPQESPVGVQRELVTAANGSVSGAADGASHFEDEAWVAQVLSGMPDETPTVWKPPPAEVRETVAESRPAAVVAVDAPPPSKAPPVAQSASAEPAPVSRVLLEPAPKVSTPAITVAPPRAQPSVLRRVILLGVAVQLVLVGGVFAVGYLLGSYNSASTGRLAVTVAGALGHQPVRIKGRAVYESPVGEVLGDAQAAMIVVPDGKLLSPLPKVEQLGPSATAPDDAHPALGALRRAGGQYARCQANGSFDVAVSSPGAFRVLVISGHANRSTGGIDDVDAREMNAALPGIENAIGPHRYYWLKVDVPLGGSNLHVHFGGTSAKAM